MQKEKILERLKLGLKSSQYKGVSYNFKHKRYRVTYDKIYIGTYETDEEAAWSWDMSNLLLEKYVNAKGFIYQNLKYYYKNEEIKKYFKLITLTKRILELIRDNKFDINIDDVKTRYNFHQINNINHDYLPEYEKKEFIIKW